VTGPPAIKLLFDHLPKCAGTSVYRLLQQAVGAGRVSPFLQAVAAGSAVRLFSRYDVIAGHFAGQILVASPWPTRTFTIVRDPVSRLRSLYRYSREIGRGPAADLMRQMSFAEFVESEHPFLVAPLDNFLTAHFAEALGLVTDPDDLLPMAKEAVTRYDLVGIFSDLDETAQRLCRLLGEPAAALPKLNAGDSGVAQSVDSATIRTIESRNRLDLELYDFIVERFKGGGRSDSGSGRTFRDVAPTQTLEFGDRRVTIDELSVDGAAIAPPAAKQVVSGDLLEIGFVLASQIHETELCLLVALRNVFGDLVYATNTSHAGRSFRVEPGTRRQVRIRLPVNLGYGGYYLSLAVHRRGELVHRRYFHRIENALRFDVVEVSREVFLGQTNLRAVIDVS